MRVVAECDELMKNAMLSMCDRNLKCAEKVAELDSDVLKFIDEMKANYSIAIEGNLATRLDTRAVDSSKLFKHFRRLTKIATSDPTTFGLDEVSLDRLRELRQQSAQYASLVLHKRNVLGHVVEEQTETGWVIRNSEEISVRDFADIRKSFAEHIDAIRGICSLVVNERNPKEEGTV